jgi:hypothetical protein
MEMCLSRHTVEKTKIDINFNYVNYSIIDCGEESTNQVLEESKIF